MGLVFHRFGVDTVDTVDKNVENCTTLQESTKKACALRVERDKQPIPVDSFLRKLCITM
jgi:hypothetical protein